MSWVQTVGKFFFKWRDKLPIPLVLAMISYAKPSKISWLLGLPFVFAGELVRLWGLMHIGHTTRTRSICADKLITSGPYSHCRNPLYFANFLKITGFLIISRNFYYSLVVACFYTAEFTTMIPYEEGFLAKKFPEEHKKYKKLVPIFVPSLTPSTEMAGNNSFSFKEAATSEKKTFASTASILLLLAISSFRKEEK